MAATYGSYQSTCNSYNMNYDQQSYGYDNSNYYMNNMVSNDHTSFASIIYVSLV